MPTTTAITKAAPAAKSGRKGNPAALSRPMKPSTELAAIVGHHALPRTDVVAKVWAHIRANGCQDPADKRVIVADAKLRPVLGKDRCTMFELNKLLSEHLKAA